MNNLEKVKRSDFAMQFLQLAGIKITPDPSQRGMYHWFESDISYHSYDEAALAAISVAAEIVIQETLATKLPYPEEYWEILPDHQKLSFAREAFEFENLGKGNRHGHH